MMSDDERENCFICDKIVLSDKVIPSLSAIETIKLCSVERGDGKHRLITSEQNNIFVHKECRNRYTKSFYIEQAKRQSSEQFEHSASPKRLRSTGSFDFINDCFLCSNEVSRNEIRSRKGRKGVSDCLLQNIKDEAVNKNDSWGYQVLGRIATAKSLNVNDVVYHHACLKQFRTPVLSTSSTPGRPPSDEVVKAMQVIYSHLEEHDDCQFSLLEICDLVKDFKISVQTIKTKLVEHYKENIFITCTQAKVPVVCFKNVGHKVLSNHWYQKRKLSVEEEELRIMVKAAEIARKHIEISAYDNTVYPNPFGFVDNDKVEESIPKPLTVFLDTLTTKTKRSTKPKELKKRCAVLAHCLISLVKPRSFKSTILLSIGSYIYQKIGSKSLINMLSNLGLCSSYHDVKVLETSLILSPSHAIKPKTFTQFVFDNCDINVDTIDGKGTFHYMAGIKCVTPRESILNSSEQIPKQTRLRQSDIAEKKGVTEVMPYRHSIASGLDSFVFEDLENMFPSTVNLESPTSHDVLWMISKFWNIQGIPGWQGYLEQSTSSEYSDVSRVLQLPFIMAPPTDYDTIYTALQMAVNDAKKIGLTAVFVTFDLPLYMKATDIILSASPQSPLKNVYARLGGFHVVMSFLGSIGYIMADSGLKELLSIVYAENTVKHILSGHAYARAIRGHILVSSALMKLILKDVNVNPEEQADMKTLIENFEQTPTQKDIIDNDNSVSSVTLKVKEEMLRLETVGPTAKLWIQYLNMVTLVKRFLEAERTGNWNLHLNTVKMMLPYFTASGHLHYAKACQIYLQTMHNLPNTMDPLEFNRFVNGYFTVRRTNKFCSGTSPDMVIEQSANREFKVMGGINKRGYTDEVLSAYIMARPAFSDIIDSLENFSGFRLFTSEQHLDARDSRIKRDELDVQKIHQWLEVHDPFSMASTVVVSLGTGITGDDTINCHKTREIGQQRMKQLVGKSLKNIKMKRSDNVRPLSAVNSSIKVDNKVVYIDPMMLFQRMLFKRDENISSYFRYEIAPYPTSMFTNCGMRKNIKSALYDELQSEDVSALDQINIHVIDGGYLLHVVKWGSTPNHTYQDICTKYVSYVQRSYSSPVVVFDGYDDPNNTKHCEQLRRSKVSGPQYQISEATRVTVNQERFLSNVHNKKQLISMLVVAFEKSFIEVKQACGDADTLIVNTAIERSSSTNTVGIIGQDTDIAVILAALAPDDKELFMVKPKIGKTPTKIYSSQNLHQQNNGMKEYILLAHAFSGCDTTSAIYGKGKKQMLKLLARESGLVDIVNIFNKPDATKSEIKTAGETLFLFLYGEKDNSHSLDELRFILFQKSLPKAAARLEALPPTSAGAEQHAFRTYYQVQKWLGNDLDPEDWGWCRQHGELMPIKTTLDPAPQAILKMISCSCKGPCSSLQCSCLKSGVLCTTLCKYCEGTSCDNSEKEPLTRLLDDEEDGNDDPSWNANQGE